MTRLLKISTGLIFVTALTVSLGFYFSGDDKEKDETTSADGTKLGVVKKGKIVQMVTIPGSIIPNRQTVIKPPYNGYVKKIYVKVGQDVKKGDKIVSVSEALTTQEETFPLLAPFSGRVVQVLCSEGQNVEQHGSNNSLVRIDDLSKMFIEANVPELDMVKLKKGQSASVKASAILGRKYKGVLRDIALASKIAEGWRDSNSEFSVRIEITDPDEHLKPGLSALVDVIADQRSDVLTLRHEFIEKSNDKFFVTLANGEKKEITLGLQDENASEVLTGVGENKKVKQVDFLAKAEEE